MHILHFPFFFLTNTGLASHSGWNTSLMNPASKSLCTSSPIARRLSSSKCRKCCLTVLEFGRISRECSATSLGMPGMSEGLHAEMSALARRKSTSTTSYLLSSVALIFSTLPSGVFGLRGISLAPSAASKLPACHCLDSIASLAILCRSAARASSIANASACLTHSTSHS